MDEMKFRMGYEPPKDRDIERKKNFEQVKAEAVSSNAAPFRSWKGLVGGGAVLIGIGMILGYYLSGQESGSSGSSSKGPPDKKVEHIPGAKASNEGDVLPGTDSSSTKRGPALDPPLEGMNVPYRTFRVDPRKGDTVEMPSSLRLFIPADAFIRNGQAVRGPVSLRVRDFYNPLEMYLAGIPMKNNSPGEKGRLVSAGMVEVRAMDKNGEALSLKEGRSIGVDAPVCDQGDEFGKYALDVENGEWNRSGEVDFVDPRSEGEEDLKTKDKKGRSPRGPISPEPHNTDRYAFRIAFDKDAFPELAPYEDILFEVIDSVTAFDPRLYQVNWDQMELQRGAEEKERYRLKLTRRTRKVELAVKPVFEEEDFAAAKKQYKEEKEAFRKKRERIREKEARDTRAIEDRVQQGLGGGPGMGTRSRFSIGNMGVHNVDIPAPPPGKKDPMPRFVAEEEKLLEPKNVHFSPKGVNTIRSFNGDENKIRYYPDNELILWVTTEQGKIGIIKGGVRKELKKIGKATLKVEVFPPDEGLEILSGLQELNAIRSSRRSS